MPPVSWPLRTERLTIRPAVAGDAAATWAFRRLPEVAEWITHAPADFAAYAEHFAVPERLASTLLIERDGEVVGDLMLRVEDAWSQGEIAEQAVGRQAELGWCVAPGHRGQGYGTEAVRALLGACFEQLGVHRVVALCFTDNTASWRLMERIGMRREAHTVRDSLHRSGVWLDGYAYALLADEWSALTG
jgi:RimJ/RimL family protein N-acetyltransferase